MVDLWDVPVLLVWLGLALSVGTGVYLGLAQPQRIDLAVVCFVMAAGALVGALCGCLRGGWPRWLLVIAALATALMWGFTHGQRDGEIHRAADRGIASGVVTFEVERASRSGPRCRVLAHPWASPRREFKDTATWSLRLPEELCPLGAGALLRMRATDLAPVTGLPRSGSAVRAPARGASHHARADLVWVQSPSRSVYWGAVAMLRQRAWELSRGDDAVALISAGVLGQVEALPPQQRRALRRAGLGHLIAVSGLHVAVAAFLAQSWLLRVSAGFGWSPRWAVAIAWVPVVAYVGLTGASAPAVRAATMLGVLDLGILVGRPIHAPTVLAFSAAGMLAVRPLWAADVGFQLSVAAMAVVVTSPPGAGLLLQTWRITWGLAALTMLHFGQVGAAGLLANLVAIPLFSAWVLPAGVLGWLAVPWLGPGALEPAAWGAEVILAIAAALGHGPPLPGWVVAMVAAVSLLLRPWIRAPWVRRLHPPVLGAVATIAVVAMMSWPSDPPGSEDAPRWWVIGRGPRPTVIASVLDQPGRVCIDAPAGAAARWPATLAGLEIEGVIRVVDSAGDDAPHVMALRDALERAGLWEPSSARCAWPDRSLARKAAKRCGRLGRGVVVAMSTGASGIVRCHRRGEWLQLQVKSPAGAP